MLLDSKLGFVMVEQGMGTNFTTHGISSKKEAYGPSDSHHPAKGCAWLGCTMGYVPAQVPLSLLICAVWFERGQEHPIKLKNPKPCGQRYSLASIKNVLFSVANQHRFWLGVLGLLC